LWGVESEVKILENLEGCHRISASSEPVKGPLPHASGMSSLSSSLLRSSLYCERSERDFFWHISGCVYKHVVI
jgi:hypothetical protein